jgi:serine/threonine protein kinase
MGDFLGEPGKAAAEYKYLKKKPLGRGQFGEAWVVERTSDQQVFVAKEMKLDKMSARDKEYVYSEIKCLAVCNHPCVIQFVEDKETEDMVVIIMEYADGGDLERHLKARVAENKYFQEHEVIFMFLQLCMALHHIHLNRMLHRDLKSANVFIRSSGVVALGDFGFSHQYDETVSEAVGNTFLGTPFYLAPELWRNERYSKKADVWALGIILYELLALKRPYTANSMKELMQKVLTKEIPPIPSHYSPAMAELIKAILIIDPKQRPSIADIFQIEYVKQNLKALGDVISRNARIPQAMKDSLGKSIAEAASASTTGTAQCGAVGCINKDLTFSGTVSRMSGGGRTWKDRHLMLKNGMVILGDGPEDANAKGLPLEEVRNACEVHISTAKRENVFALNTTGGKSMWLQAPTRQEMQQWVHILQQACGLA